MTGSPFCLKITKAQRNTHIQFADASSFYTNVLSETFLSFVDISSSDKRYECMQLELIDMETMPVFLGEL